VSATSAIDLAEGIQSYPVVPDISFLVFVWSGSLLAVLLFFFTRWLSKPREKDPKRVTPQAPAEPEIELPSPPPPSKAVLMQQETARHEETMEAISYAKLGDIERELAIREENEKHQHSVKRILGS
jgi:hypothetical protein